MEIDLSWESGFAPEDAQETFEELLKTSDEELVEAMQDAGNNIEKGARQRAPVDTGNLKASYESETDHSGDEITTEVGTNTEYAVHVEFGTQNMDAQPHLRPAIDDEEGRLEDRIVERVFEAAEDAGDTK